MVKKKKKVTRIDPVRTTQPLEQTQEKRVCAYCRISTDSEDQKQLLRAYRRRESLLAGSQMDGRREPSKKFLKIRFTKGICFYRRLVLQKVYHLERNGTMENFLNI